MLRPAVVSSRALLLRQPRTALLSSETSAREPRAQRERGPKPQAIEGSVPVSRLVSWLDSAMPMKLTSEPLCV